jgi:hypothetical protein
LRANFRGEFALISKFRFNYLLQKFYSKHRTDNPIAASEIEPQHDAEPLSKKTGQLISIILEEYSLVLSYICSYYTFWPVVYTKGFF